MNRPTFFVFMLIAAAIFAAGTAMAARPSPPQSVGIDVISVSSWTSAGVPQYSANVNVTFHLSAQDPDQSTGDPTYTEYVTGLSPGTITPLPASRAAWVYYVEGIGPSTDATAVRTWNITWNDGSGAEGESIGSCEVTVDLRVVDDHDQCSPEEEEPDAPTGVNGVITQTVTPTTGEAEIRFTVSAQDPDQVQGDLTYVVRYTTEQLDGVFLEYVDPTTGDDAAGVRFFTDQYAGGATVLARYDVYVKDQRTRLWSEASCYIELDQDIIHYQSACGNLTVPDVTLNPNGPQFPLVNVTAGADALGLSDTQFGLILGGGTIATGAMLGAAVGGGVIGAAVGGTMAFALAASLNLVPLWAVVLVFMAAVGIAVTFWTRGSGGGA
jgi:hypothetical protein